MHITSRSIKVTFLMLLILVSGLRVSESAENFRIERQEEAYLGCEVVLSLDGDVIKTPGIVYEWSFEGNAKPIHLRRGGAECRFTPIDAEPITAIVTALNPEGIFLASADISMVAKEFSVDIVMLAPKPFMLWDANTKQDVAAEGLIAGEDIQFKVELTPEFKNEIKCRWNTDASTAIRGGENDIQVTIVRNEIGDAELSVVVADIHGTLLGRGSKHINVPIAKSMVEDSVRRKEAWGLWTTALTLWDAKNFDEAIQNAQAAATMDPETIEITDGLKTLNSYYARVERSRKLNVEATALRGEQRLADALKTLRRSYAAWALQETEASIKELESEIDKIREKRQQAEWLRDTGAAYDQEGFFEEALKLYKETLAIQPDPSLEQRADRIEKRLASIAQANTFAQEGRKLETEAQLLAAVEKYKESLKLEANADLDNHMKELEETIKERRTRAATLLREATDLQKKNKNAEALLRYRESQALWPDAALEKRIADLEKIVTESPQQVVRSPEDFGIGTQADATRLLQEGHVLYKQGKYREALEGYRKSYAISKDQRLADWISRVETSLKEYEAVLRANILIKEANNLYNEGKFTEALTKYKESLVIHPNAEVENFTKHIEDNIKSADVVSKTVPAE